MSHHWFCDTDIACFRKARKILKSWSLLRRGSQPFHGSLSQAACLNSETFSDVKDHTLVDNSMKLKLWNLKHSYIALSDFIHKQASLQGTASALSILSMVQNLSCVFPCRKLCSTPRAGLAKRSVVFGARFKLEQLHGCICSQPLKVADPEWSLESPPGLQSKTMLHSMATCARSLMALNGSQLTKTHFFPTKIPIRQRSNYWMQAWPSLRAPEDLRAQILLVYAFGDKSAPIERCWGVVI